MENDQCKGAAGGHGLLSPPVQVSLGPVWRLPGLCPHQTVDVGQATGCCSAPAAQGRVLAAELVHLGTQRLPSTDCSCQPDAHVPGDTQGCVAVTAADEASVITELEHRMQLFPELERSREV